jgi:hypothetical protein
MPRDGKDKSYLQRASMSIEIEREKITCSSGGSSAAYPLPPLLDPLGLISCATGGTPLNVRPSYAISACIKRSPKMFPTIFSEIET